MRRTVVVLAAAAVAFLAGGCMRAISEGYGATAGAKPMVVQIDPVQPAELGPATVEPITSDVGPAADATWLSMLTAQARTRCEQSDKVRSGTRAVAIAGRVIHLEGAGMVGQALGPDSQVIVRMTMKDSKTGQVLSTANVIGRARSTTSSSQEDLCKAFGEAVAKWVELSRPKNEGD